jgi:hypothetical protein
MDTFFTQEDVIDAYTRKQAIEDGVLIDVTETAKEAGIRFPVAVTIGVWSKCIKVPETLKGLQDEQGRLWDVVWMMRIAIHGAKKTDTVNYKLLVTGEDKKQHLVTLKAICGPGDNYEPVITIMLPEED